MIATPQTEAEWKARYRWITNAYRAGRLWAQRNPYAEMEQIAAQVSRYEKKHGPEVAQCFRIAVSRENWEPTEGSVFYQNTRND